MEKWPLERLPISALLHFEAAARLSSFTLAACELNVTQAAVSKQIRTLESQLGVKLFSRHHRSVALTSAGAELSLTMSNCVTAINSALRSIVAPAGGDELNVTALISFANLWLVPRLSSFQVQNPDVRIGVFTNDRDAVVGPETDVVLRFGDGRWPDGEAVYLFRERVFPVASPEYIERYGQPRSVSDLRDHRLIGYSRVNRDWLDWDDWLNKFSPGQPPVRLSSRFSFYTDAVSSALRSEGILLGWEALITEHLRTGRLRRLTHHACTTESAHYAIPLKSPATNPNIPRFIEWLRATAQAESASS